MSYSYTNYFHLFHFFVALYEIVSYIIKEGRKQTKEKDAKMENSKNYNQGKADGTTAKNSQFPAHKMWPAEGHFNKEYEKGYWDGYNEM